jgi:hypothetical protein
MSFNIDDLPTIEGSSRLGRRPDADSPVAEAYLTDQTLVSNPLGSLSMTLGVEFARLLQARLFPSAAQLSALQAAAAPSYTTHADCGGFNYNATCDEACFGFAPHHMDPFYCATCDEQAADPGNNPFFNWHFVGSRGQIQYIDREPDVCAGRDAWKWKIVGACGDCNNSAVFRCHDGYKKYPDSTTWDPTICQGLVSCDDQLNLCD